MNDLEMKTFAQFEKRKQDHIKLALMPNNQASEYKALDQVNLIHEALPDLNFNEIQIQTTRFGQSKNPFFVSSMTAGHDRALEINGNLMAACETLGWAMGVGSQRRELTDKQAFRDWEKLRDTYSKVSLFSNLGIAQLITTPVEKLKQLSSVIQAEAFIIHCNPLQEVIQPEGTPFFKGAFDKLKCLTDTIDLPVVIKETGCGFSVKTMENLNNLGIAALDVSGLGGTHWGRIEGHRAKEDYSRMRASETFRNWGINTVNSIQAANSLTSRKFEIWGSGGVHNGLDAAKLFALGASSVGFAKIMLEAALQSSEEVVKEMMAIEYELKVAMFCTGSQYLSELKEKIWPM